MPILFILAIAVSLSMDAFSLALAYGTLSLSKKHILKLSTIVGIYHFFMPLLGMVLGTYLFHILPIQPESIVFLILTFIGVQMIFETFKKNEHQDLRNNAQLFLFGLAVSLDSFSIGIGLKTIGNPILCSITFSICSLLFTYLGLILGKKISSMIGQISTLIGGIALILLGIIYLLYS